VRELEPMYHQMILREIGVDTAIDLNPIGGELVVAVRASELIRTRHCVLIFSLPSEARPARGNPVLIE